MHLSQGYLLPDFICQSSVCPNVYRYRSKADKVWQICKSYILQKHRQVAVRKPELANWQFAAAFLSSGPDGFLCSQSPEHTVFYCLAPRAKTRDSIGVFSLVASASHPYEGELPGKKEAKEYEVRPQRIL